MLLQMLHVLAAVLETCQCHHPCVLVGGEVAVTQGVLEETMMWLNTLLAALSDTDDTINRWLD